MSAVADHVAACAACRAEVEAFTAARSLLPLSSLSFGESERASVRRRVLDEIAKTAEKSVVLRRHSAPATVRPGGARGSIVVAASLVSPVLRPDRRGARGDAALPGRLPETPAPAEERTAEAAPLLPERPAAISRVPRVSKRAPAARAGYEKSGPAMRFEIQTGNVNVRIIWFAGGTSGGDRPPARRRPERRLVTRARARRRNS